MPRAEPLGEPLLPEGGGSHLRTSTALRLRDFTEQLARESIVTGAALVRTPSAARDLEAAVAADRSVPAAVARRGALGRVAKAQRARAQLRQLDAEILELQAQVQRAAVLRGPSSERYICDGDCVLGGCEGEFAAEDGVLCSDCSLFLCEPCFGSALVANECPGEGRYMRNMDGSPSGSLPCPLFPQGCTCGHIPLPRIQKALLHSENRGADGDVEDLNSAGTSPHKLHLLARRRWAEAQATEAGGEAEGGGEMLLRMFSQATRQTLTLSRTRSDTRAALADKLNELDQLKKELLANPPGSSIPPADLRICARCNGEYAAWEGGQCDSSQHSHFLCAICFGGYVMRACAEGGDYEREIKAQDTGVVVSAAGCLPCPFWEGHTRSPLAPHASTLRPQHEEPEPELEAGADVRGSQMARPGVSHPVSPTPSGSVATVACSCGAVPMAVIEQVMIDPRNSSAAFWRERHAEVVIESHSTATITIGSRRNNLIGPNADGLPPDWTMELDHMSNQPIYFNSVTNEVSFERPPPEEWSREVEVLGRGFCPHNVWETARLRVALAENRAVAAEMAAARGHLSSDPRELALATLRVKVTDALERGGCTQCPRCGVRVLKDEKCIHMDSCPCDSRWCYLCGKEGCPRGGGGCDEDGIFLHNLAGWSNFNIGSESSAIGAQNEFLRRRQAFMVRAVKEETDADLWVALRKKHPALLRDVPTPGRQIEWESLDHAEYPLFGARARARQDGASGRFDDTFVPREVAVDADAQTRLLAAFERERRAEEERAQRRRQAEARRVEERRRQQARDRARIAEQRARFEEADRQVATRRRWSCCVTVSMMTVAILLVLATTQIMTHQPPMNPMVAPEPEPEPLPEPEPEPESSAAAFKCNWACSALQLVPVVELAIGSALHICTHIFAIVRDQRRFNIGDVNGLGEFFIASLLGGVAAFWHAMITPRDLVTSNFTTWFALPWLGGIPSGLWLLAQVEGMYTALHGRHFWAATSGRSHIAGLLVVAHVVMYYALPAAVFVANHDLRHLKPEPRVEYQCDWVCDALWLVPLAELGLCAVCFVAFLFCLMCKEDVPRHMDFMRAGPYSCCFGVTVHTLASSMACGLAHWPALLWWLSPVTFVEGHVLVSYILAPVCSGALAPFIALNALRFVGESYGYELQWRRFHEYTTISAMVSLLQLFGYVVGVAYVRNWSEPSTVDFECTWPCMALRGEAIASLIAVLPAGKLIWSEELDAYSRRVHELSCAFRVSAGIGGMLIALFCFGLPLWLSLLRPQILVNGFGLWVYLLVAGIPALNFGGATAVSFHRLRDGQQRDSNKELCIPSIVTVLYGTAAVWLLWIFRQSLDPTFAQPLSRSAHNEMVLVWVTIAVNWLGLLLLVWRSSLGHPVADAVGPINARRHLHASMVASYRFGAALRCAFLWLPVAGVTLYITTSMDNLPDLDDACRKHLCFPYLGVLVTAIGWCCELCRCQVLLTRTALHRALRVYEFHVAGMPRPVDHQVR